MVGVVLRRGAPTQDQGGRRQVGRSDDEARMRARARDDGRAAAVAGGRVAAKGMSDEHEGTFHGVVATAAGARTTSRSLEPRSAQTVAWQGPRALEAWERRPEPVVPPSADVRYTSAAGKPMSRQVQRRLAQSYALDRLWSETMGLLPSDTKQRPLRAVVAVLEASRTPYALIGGVAMQMLSKEPRTTLDIDLAVRTFAEIPRQALQKAGFVHEGRHAQATIGVHRGTLRVRAGWQSSFRRRTWASMPPSLALVSSTPVTFSSGSRAQRTCWCSSSPQPRSQAAGQARGARICWMS